MMIVDSTRADKKKAVIVLVLLSNDWVYDQFTLCHICFRFMVTEVYDDPAKLVIYYGSEEEKEADFPFNFQLIGLEADKLTGTEVHRLVDDWIQATPDGKWPNWVVRRVSIFVFLHNHDN